MLPGCSKADDHTAVNGGLTKATNNNHQTQAGYSQNDEPQANQNIDEFLNDYINLIRYFYSAEFRSGYHIEIYKASIQYLNNKENAIIACNEIFTAAKDKLDELEQVNVPEGLGLKNKHDNVIRAKNGYERSVSNLIRAMEDGCSPLEFTDKRKNIEFSMEMFKDALAGANNQAVAKINERKANGFNRKNSNLISKGYALEILKSKIKLIDGQFIGFESQREILGNNYYLFTIYNEYSTEAAYCIDVNTGEVFKCDQEMNLTPLAK